jgi:RNase H-fold protein (predicted Holliday junction resolvase)
VTAVPRAVLSIDPGTAKCGVAVVHAADEIGPVRALHREVAETPRLVARTLALLIAYPEVEAILIGNATRGSVLRRALIEALPLGFPVHAVEEAFTSQRARVRFQIEHPPRGWQRLIPPGLRTPPIPYDDYVAILLAEDWYSPPATLATV